MVVLELDWAGCNELGRGEGLGWVGLGVRMDGCCGVGWGGILALLWMDG